jgi:hypothetical protein
VTSWLLLLAIISAAPQNTTCADAASCRQAALEAEARQDYEAFHDLAWKAAARTKPNDPDSMRMLARAQSLSGRPGDALVMLRRLAEMGVAVDAAGEEFRRVRSLPGWSEVERAIANARERSTAGASTAAARAEPPMTEAARPREAPAAPTAPSPASDARSPAAGDAAPRAHTLPSLADPGAAADALRFTESTAIDPVALAYDSASRRFVLADRGRNRLVVADEVFKRVNALIGAVSGGFGALTALEIDRRRGDLWVASEIDGNAAVHKLQLVSGRVLSRLDLPAEWAPAQIADLAIDADGTIVLLDAKGSRLLLLPQPGRAFGTAIRLRAEAPTSVAAGAHGAYVAHEKGLLFVNLKSGAVREVTAPEDVTLSGLERIRWHGGSLIGIQHAGGTSGIVRLTLASSGRRVSRAARLDDHRPEKGSTLTIGGDAAYYVARDEGSPVIRRVALR